MTRELESVVNQDEKRFNLFISLSLKSTTQNKHYHTSIAYESYRREDILKDGKEILRFLERDLSHLGQMETRNAENGHDNRGLS